MSLIATAVKHLIAAGASGDDLVRAIAEMEAALAPDTRSSAAKRQARYRERIAERNETRNEASQSVTCDDNVTPTPSLDKSPPYPQKLNPTPHTHGEPRPRVKAWACPEGVDPQHWRDFMANRKRKRLTNTDTAYAGQLRLLEQFSDDEWPPGRLVQTAAEKGWGTIVNPHDSFSGNSGHGQRNGSRHDRDEIQSPLLRAALGSA